MKQHHSKPKKDHKKGIQFLIGLILFVIVILWTIPTFGVFITSFRDSRDIYASGWWSVLPHKDFVKTDEFVIPRETDPNAPVTIEGVTADFEDWRQGVAITET
ncbi:MAG: hypothetical protein PQJ60_00680, partial [Spirochaetales bacterium]|nr:hypothetical protein [Spirochaetales bacterium]